MGRKHLIKDGAFSLPGRKALLKSDMDYEVVLIDVTKSPIERPKKAKALLQWQEKEAYSKVVDGCKQSEWTDHLHLFC